MTKNEKEGAAQAQISQCPSASDALEQMRPQSPAQSKVEGNFKTSPYTSNSRHQYDINLN